MVGKTLTALKRNCLTYLDEFCNGLFKYSIPKKEAEFMGKRIFLEGVNDSRAENKIRGMTLQAVYCDELTLFTYDFFAMLLSRLSLPKSKLIGTTNPDSPNHWLNVNYLNRAEELNLNIASEYLIMAAELLADRQENYGKTIVVLLPDSGERYLSSDIFDS